MVNTPFALSFEEIKAQADANIQADRAGQGGEKPQTGEKSFLNMVEEAEKQWAKETRRLRQPQRYLQGSRLTISLHRRRA